jgi:hypothetical protein
MRLTTNQLFSLLLVAGLVAVPACADKDDSGDGSDGSDGGDDGSDDGDDGSGDGGTGTGGDDGSGDGGDDGSDGGSDDGGSDTGDDGDTGDGGGEDPPDGDPLPDSAEGEWEYIEIDGAVCRSGSPAGFAYRRGSSNNLMIFFMGGNACFNGGSCLITPDSVETQTGGNSGIFDTANAANPVADWHHVFVPYCTGDVHGGNNPDGGTLAGTTGQLFVGWVNTGLFLARIHPTWADVDKVVITGGSAGGFGAAVNFERMVKRWPDAEMILLDDAGPPMADEYMTPCLQQHWRDTWGFNDTFLQGCGSPCLDQADGGGFIHFVPHLAETYPDARMAIISSEEDSVMRQFWGYGNDNCANLDGFFPPEYAGAKFAEGLYDLRDNWATGDGWGSYFTPGSQHTFFGGQDYYDRTVNGVVLVDWVSDMIDGTVTDVAP